ncbi:hypothetical protein C8F04DRAFT_1201377 [Mycena alexandri]|uniref:Uncharacterized protein n=1 Tax=Mycena alexandri TaxID=1745969 RepID=A0AAD6RWZ1_9AGAR|nr:hypothetical protein C8F04DRAFT_1201377 [Mycena alexandri]
MLSLRVVFLVRPVPKARFILLLLRLASLIPCSGSAVIRPPGRNLRSEGRNEITHMVDAAKEVGVKFFHLSSGLDIPKLTGGKFKHVVVTELRTGVSSFEGRGCEEGGFHGTMGQYGVRRELSIKEVEFLYPSGSRPILHIDWAKFCPELRVQDGATRRLVMNTTFDGQGYWRPVPPWQFRVDSEFQGKAKCSEFELETINLRRDAGGITVLRAELWERVVAWNQPAIHGMDDGNTATSFFNRAGPRISWLSRRVKVASSRGLGVQLFVVLTADYYGASACYPGRLSNGNSEHGHGRGVRLRCGFKLDGLILYCGDDGNYRRVPELVKDGQLEGRKGDGQDETLTEMPVLARVISVLRRLRLTWIQPTMNAVCYTDTGNSQRPGGLGIHRN